MKKWKKNKRHRKNVKKTKNTCNITLVFSNDEIEIYNKINDYRIKHGYSWSKLASISLKNAISMEGKVNE